MLFVVVVLAVIAAAALAGLGYTTYRLVQPTEPGRISLAPDEAAAAALDRSPRPAGAPAGTRRLISIEILNPIELAGTRHRLLGIAGSLAPGLTRRVVYDQVLRIIKQQLDEQHVVADVRLHTLRPAPAPGGTPVDEVRRVDLGAVDEPDESGGGEVATDGRR